MKNNYQKKFLCIVIIGLLGLTGCANKYRDVDTYIDYAADKINSIDDTFFEQSASLYKTLGLTDERQQQLDIYKELIASLLNFLPDGSEKTMYEGFTDEIDEKINAEFLNNELKAEKIVIELYNKSTDEQKSVIHDYFGEIINIFDSVAQYIINSADNIDLENTDDLVGIGKEEIIDSITSDQAVIDYLKGEGTKIFNYAKDNSSAILSFYDE